MSIWPTDCEHPSDCIRLANKLIETLPPKWNPCEPHNTTLANPDDGTKGWLPFSHTVLTAELVKDIFPIFTEGETSNEILTMTIAKPRQKTFVATDRSTQGVGTTTARAGARIFYTENNPKNTSLRLLLDFPPTNQSTELIAIKLTAEDNIETPDLYIESNSRYVINALTKNLIKHKDLRYIGMANVKALQATIAALGG